MGGGNGLAESFIGALQAAVSVLLTIVWGVLAGQFKLLDLNSSGQIAKLCVNLFMPALFISKVGPELDADNITRYLAILVWSLLYTFSSIALAIGLKRALKLPSWTIVATAFNNTTAMPLLLVQTLASTGILESLLVSETDTVEKIVNRAQSYFLVNALIGNVITFTIGPKLLDGPTHPSDEHSEPDDTAGALQVHRAEEPDETTSLLPAPVLNHTAHAADKLQTKGNQLFQRLPAPMQKALSVVSSSINPPLVGGIMAVLIGMVPALHRVFFNGAREGGIFNAWLTTSIQNMGDLFAALQIIVVGVKLSACLQRMVRGEDSGRMPVRSLVSILTFRYVLWPLVSIGIIYPICSRTRVLSDDPVLWLAMMLMPCGPSAMNLTSLTDVAGSDEEEQFGLAKFLTISYGVSPLLAFAVVGGLKACEAAMKG